MISSFAIITTPANEMMEQIHNLKKRMPFILKKQDEYLWLRSDLAENEIREMMEPYPSRLMTAYTISKRLASRGVDRNVEDVLNEEKYDEVEILMKGTI